MFWDAEYGAKSTLTGIIGRMATYSGEVIDFEKALNSGIDLMPKNYSFDADPLIMPDANGMYAIATPGRTRYNVS
ncbi:hypothetical protein [Niabella hibiscisoli]|uniref:hypothetical protein n=1 Tax=Niabella hibiscisoli TaxID=1825928 RepID=UPI001F0F3277|nr:hypothetical protein [Niabella hibiscisoli]MCH5718252.1 hypothetical protein [Niabella hibiscisoli]